MNNNPSICIPRIDKNISHKFIYNIINKHQLGEIQKINLIQIGKFQRAYINFKQWYNNEKSLKVKNLLLAKEDFKIMYMHPWYWKCTVVH